MNTNMMELNLNEMEQANGGWDWLSAAMGALIGGSGGAAIGVISVAASVAIGPVGWVALVGGTAVAVGAITGNFD